MAFVCCHLVFEFSVGIESFCHRTESDLLLFLFVQRTLCLWTFLWVFASCSLDK